jgi:hypothetical protein
LAVAGTVGVTALIATMGIGAGVAAAAPPADPAGGAVPVAPSFNNGVENAIRGTGSDTTFFMMQKISDLYTGAGLYGCTLNTAAGDTLFNTLYTSTVANQQTYCKAGANIDTTDATDNWSRTEVYQGVNDVGSGAGQNQLCQTVNSPFPVDFARSSKPAGTCTVGGVNVLKGAGFAKDSVPAVDFNVNPAAQFGQVTASGSPYASVNGGNVGPVTSGWEPGDNISGPYSGTAFSGVANNDNSGLATSTAYRLWCAIDSTRITDWGQLTNLGPNLAVVNVTLNGTTTATVTGSFPAAVAAGQAVTDRSTPGNIAAGTTVSSVSGGTLTLSPAATGSGTDTLSINIGSALPADTGAPIGLPVRIQGVNSASGTTATFSGFAESGVSGGGCPTDANINAANNPSVPGSAKHIALENNASQVSDFAANDFPGDVPSQAVEVGTTLYFMSNGVYTSSTYSAAASVNGVSVPAVKLSMNTKSTTTPNVLNNIYPTSRTLFNVYRTDTVRASAGGFFNWVCDSNTAIAKGKDNSTGKNFDAELTSLIGSFGFIRLTDTSTVASTPNPADGVVGGGVNTSCASGLNGGSTAGNGTPVVTAVGNTQG